MLEQCNHTSVGQIVKKGEKILVVERYIHPTAYALIAGHVEAEETFAEASIRKTREETGVKILENRRILKGERIDNPCKASDGNHHLWEVYKATSWTGNLNINDSNNDAGRVFWATPLELEAIAKRTEYFLEKYQLKPRLVKRGAKGLFLPHSSLKTEMVALSKAIFGKNNNPKNTDKEWQDNMGLEPVWYYLLKKFGKVE